MNGNQEWKAGAAYAAIVAALACLGGAGCAGDGPGTDGGSTGRTSGDADAALDGGSEGGTGFDSGPDTGADDAGADAGDGATPAADAEAGVEPPPTRQPDTPTNKVDSCLGVPDMTLCEVVTTPDRWYDVCVDEQCVSPGCGDLSCNTPGSHFVHPPMSGRRFLELVTGDEPVTIELYSGLYFTSCAAGQLGADCGEGSQQNLTIDEALAHCDELSWGGFDDWYLPDIFELLTLIDLDVPHGNSLADFDGHLDFEAFPGLEGVRGYYWSTTRIDDDRHVLSTGKDNFNYHALVYLDDYSTTNAVLCVRRGFSKPMPPGGRLVRHDGDEPTVEDRAGGLVFQGCSNSPTGDCSEKLAASLAHAHCEDLVWAGHDDWRLPSFTEVHGLFNPRIEGFAPELDSRFYLVVDDGKNAGKPAIIDPETGERVGLGSDSEEYARCVRDAD